MNISLIGMSGVGKSTIGKKLSKKLGYNFIDIDLLIERENNMKLQSLLDSSGKENFLRVEEEAILGLGMLDRTVISPGGSVVYSDKAMKFLKMRSKVIFLDAPLESIRKRVPNFSERGVIGLKEKGLKALFEERHELYRKYADLTISLPKKFDKDSIVTQIIEKIKEREN
jgi:shikimate kinase